MGGKKNRNQSRIRMPWNSKKESGKTEQQQSTLLSPPGSAQSIRKQLRSLSPFGRRSEIVTSSTSSTTSPAQNATSTPAPTHNNSNVSATASTCKDPSPWEMSAAIDIANKTLREHGLPLLCNTPGKMASEIIESTVEDLQAAVKDANQKSSKAMAIQRLQDILKTFDKYAKIVDTAVQHSPEITALVWAGLRTTLQVALNYIETMESLEAATAIIAEKMAVCYFFSSIYEEARALGSFPSGLQKTLDSALPNFYAAILVFTVKAHQYFDPSTSKMTKLKYLLKSFVDEFQPFINEISEKEKRVRECADMATMDMIKKNSGKLAQIDSSLTGLQSKLVPLTKLDDMMDMIGNNFKITQQIFDGNKEILQRTERAEDERLQKLLAQLTTLESPKRHQDIQSSRLDGTGKWLLQHERYVLWRDSYTRDGVDRILCCYGDPGAGKTVLSSIVIDDLESQFPQRDKVGIAFVYCDYRDQGSQTVHNILGSLLHQLLSAASRVPNSVVEILEQNQKRGKGVDIKDISQMLNLTLAQFHRSFICIDALDELDPRMRIGLLDSLQNEFSTARIFLTGRPVVQQHVNGRLKTEQGDAVIITPDLEDILAYLHREIAVESNVNPGGMNDDLKAEILNTITAKSKGMFLLPVLHIRLVLEKPTIAQKRIALGILPDSLKGAFEEMVNRILTSPRYKDLGKRTLILLHLAYWPLKLEEFRHALAVEPGHTELVEDNIPSRQMLLDCCLGLVIVDEETMTVRFVHYTLEEHFKVHGSRYFPDRYTTAAEICLTYLNFGKLNRHCTTEDDLKKQMARFPFLEYAACHWGHYARQQDNESVTRLALNLLQQERTPSCSIQVAYSTVISIPSWEEERHSVLLTGLHVAAYFGLEKHMVTLFGSIQYWNPREEHQYTPLSIAASNGHESVVKMLLRRDDMDADSKNNDGRSPLLFAAQEGHESVVKLLLERNDVDAGSKDNDGNSPLSLAAREEHESVVKLLLERDDVDADVKDNDGWSPLALAAYNGHESIVKLLLERDDVDANSKDNTGRSPLALAALEGHESVVKLLLERDDVDADLKSDYGSSPLSSAAQKGHESVVKLLLERDDVDPDVKDNNGRSPLVLAVQNGYESIVKLLLGQNNVDADVKDNDGWSPLSWAAYNGYESIVKLLLERDDVDPDVKSNNGRSPLALAAQEGHESVVKLLLGQNNVDADVKDNDGWSPLSWAAYNGYESIVKLLLGQNNVDADVKDNDGWSPLGWAAQNGHESIVKLLLERDDVDVHVKDNNGRSPLSWATTSIRPMGVVDVVKLLLERNDVDADSKDNNGRSPLSWATTSMWATDVVKLLLERNDVDADSKDDDGKSPLSWAAYNGHESIVKVLLERDDVDANSKDNDGRSPLPWAAGNGHWSIVMLLLERNDVDANSKDNNGRSPLSWATASMWPMDVVMLLLEQNDVDADSKDDDGRSPLSWAAYNGHESIVKLLLERDDVDANSKDNNGRSPLAFAAQEGYESVVKLLLERGVGANVKDNDGWSPLALAASNGHESVVQLLLERGVDANVKDNDGWSPLALAASNGHESVVQLLLERGVDANVKDNDGWSPLALAASNGHESIVKLLLGRDDVDANSKDNDGKSALELAALEGHEHVVKLLQQHIPSVISP